MSDQATTRKFACNKTLYKAWNLMRLRCGGDERNVIREVQSTHCGVCTGKQINLQRSGTSSTKVCLSTCKIPACLLNRWGYTVSNGLEYPLYQNVNYLEVFRLAKVPSLPQYAKKTCPNKYHTVSNGPLSRIQISPASRHVIITSPSNAHVIKTMFSTTKNRYLCRKTF